MYFNDFASQIPLFFDLFFIDFSCFVRNPSWRAFLAPKTPTSTRKVNFGTHLRCPGVPKMTLGATSLRQKGSKWRVVFTRFYRGVRLGADPAPRDPQNRPKDTISSIWDWFWSDFGSIFDGFGLHLGWSFGDCSKIACNLFRICLKWCWSHFVIDVSSLLPTSHMTNHPTNHEH